ncbi:hypothetical protein M9Y10_014794 [Tritrichomonas musculus]|uniref:Transmembrane amino acid transporter protein n=1 Tax=Tritrichomonas musculus TaxID=1915356 RepID=A0ABR2L195_9EUKA
MIGGDLKVDKYRFRARPQSSNFVLFPPNPGFKPNSMFSTLILLLKVALDTDPFFMYQDMFKCGIIESLIIILVVMILIQLSVHIFTRCWFYGTSYDYQDIWACVFGSKTFSFIPAVLNIISYLTYLCWFNFEIHECARIFLLSIWPNCPSFLVNKWFLLYFFNLVAIFPCLFIKNFTSFTIISYIGNSAMVISVICLIILLIRCINEIGFEVTTSNYGSINEDLYGIPYLPNVTFFSKDPSALFGCIGTVMTAFYKHPFLEMVFANMRKPTVYRCLSSVWITSFISVLFLYGIGLLSYFIVQIHFKEALASPPFIGPKPPNDSSLKNRPYNIFSFSGHSIQDIQNENVFYNFPKKYIEAMIGQVASYIVTLTSNMIYTYFIATQVSSLVIDRRKDDVQPIVISGIVVILFSIGLNFMNDTASEFLDFVSQIAFVILVFMLPSLFYLKLFRFTKPFWGIVSTVLLVVGVPMSVAVIYYSAVDLWG